MVIFDQFFPIVITTNPAGDFCFDRLPTYINQLSVSELFFTISEIRVMQGVGVQRKFLTGKNHILTKLLHLSLLSKGP